MMQELGKWILDHCDSFYVASISLGAVGDRDSNRTKSVCRAWPACIKEGIISLWRYEVLSQLAKSSESIRWTKTLKQKATYMKQHANLLESNAFCLN